MSHEQDFTRRTVMSIGAAGLLTAATTRPSPLPNVPRQRLIVPEVDGLSLQVVTDAAVFGPFLPNLDLPGMKVIRAGNGGGPNMSRMLPHTLEGEFGLSILGESNRGTERRRVMVDFGYSREVLANNLTLLGIAPDSIDAAVLSHGHLDHYGGFAGLFGSASGNPDRPHHLPLTVGGEETFCERIAQVIHRRSWERWTGLRWQRQDMTFASGQILKLLRIRHFRPG